MKQIKIVLVIGVLIMALLPGLSASFGTNDSLDDSVSKMAGELCNAASGTSLKRIGVSEFSPTSGKPVKLGPYLSDKLTTVIAQGKSVEVIERAKLDVLIAEIRLNQTGLVDGKSAQEVGKILGVQAFVIGSYTIFPKKIDVTARLVSTETGKVLATTNASVKIDKNLKSVLEPLVPDAPLQLEAAVLAQRKTDRGWDAVMVEEGGTPLYSNDNIKIFFRTNEDCYVYALIFDSSGKASQIFPNPDISISNRIEGKRDYRVPPGNDWFWLDNKTGTETVYIIASYEPLKDVTKLLMDMEQAGTQGQLEASRKIEQELSTRGIGGIRPGENISYSTTDGKKIEKVTQVVSGKVSAVRKISFQHK